MAEVAVGRKTVVVGVLVALVLGLLLGFVLDKGSTSPSGRAPDNPNTVGPTDRINGVPVGYAQTEEGAVTAATDFSLVSTSDLVRDREGLIQAVETLAAPSWREEAVRQAEKGHEFATEHYGSDVDMTTAVLRYQLVTFTPQEASVSLWAVTIARGSKRPEPEAIWGTSRFDLEWIDGDWRVRDTKNEAGPVPAVLQSPTGDNTIQTLLEDFRDFNEGPRP